MKATITLQVLRWKEALAAESLQREEKANKGHPNGQTSGQQRGGSNANSTMRRNKQKDTDWPSLKDSAQTTGQRVPVTVQTTQLKKARPVYQTKDKRLAKPLGTSTWYSQEQTGTSRRNSLKQKLQDRYKVNQQDQNFRNCKTNTT